MALQQDEAKIKRYWNYFLALESDMAHLSRFIEINEANYRVFSIELAHLLFASSSEFEVVAKETCELLEPGVFPENSFINIAKIRKVLMRNIPEISNETVFIDKYGLRLDTPLENFAQSRSPNWWDEYNLVKHNRHIEFHKATLKNALLSLASLFIINLYYQSSKMGFTPRTIPGLVTKELKPDPQLFRYQSIHYLTPEIE